MLELQITTDAQRIRPSRPATLLVTAKNMGGAPVVAPDRIGFSWSYTLGDSSDHILGFGSTGFEAEHAGEGDVRLKPGEAHMYRCSIYAPLWAMDHTATSAPFRLWVTANIEAHDVSKMFELEADLSALERLSDLSGAPTDYYIDHGRLIFSHARLARAPKTNYPMHVIDIGPATAQSARPLSYEFLNYRDEKIYRLAKPVRGADPATFQVLSRAFAKDANKVYTTWGEAGALFADSFEACIPPPSAAHFSDDRKGTGASGYGRDARHLYFFHTYTETPKARIIKACKAPQNFVALSDLAGHDGERVFYEGQIVKKADPRSFRMLNQVFGRDDRRVFYRERMLEPQPDLESFELAPDRPFSDDSRDPIAYTNRARDKEREYEFAFERDLDEGEPSSD